MTKKIIETNTLTFDLLYELFDDKICVLFVKKYVSKEVCKKLNNLFIENTEKYTHEIRKGKKIEYQYYGVDRYGYPLNSTYNDNSGKKLKKYLKLAPNTLNLIRNAAYPYLAPIDKLRVELDEIWHYGANVAVINGYKMFCGIGRIMNPKLSYLSEQQPHFDSVPISYFPDILRQYAANIYLNVPKHGGELEIWDIEPIEIKDIDKFKIPDDWRSILPKSIKIKPEAGDLLLFNTRRPHAITKFTGCNPRTSIQTFIGINKKLELFLWD